MSLPAIPTAASLTASDVREYGATLVEWAESVDDVSEVRDAAAKWGAITEYVRRASREGVADAVAVLRRLQQRVGELLPPAVVGSHHSVAIEGAEELSKDDRHDFRLMAEHPDIVEQVIAASTDTDPASRRKVIRAIRESVAADELPAELDRLGLELGSAADRDARVEFLSQLLGALGEVIRFAHKYDATHAAHYSSDPMWSEVERDAACVIDICQSLIKGARA